MQKKETNGLKDNYLNTSATAALMVEGRVTIITLLRASAKSVLHGVLWIKVNITATTIKENAYVDTTLLTNSPPWNS
jgi:hypothetical protein